jgi:hypothetical protein
VNTATPNTPAKPVVAETNIHKVETPKRPTTPQKATPAPEATHDTDGTSLASLRERVLKMQRTPSTDPGAPGGAADTRRKALAHTDLNTLQKSAALLKATDEAIQAAKNPGTKHARALSDVAKTLRARASGTDGEPSPNSGDTTPSPRMGGAGAPRLRTFKRDVAWLVQHNKSAMAAPDTLGQTPTATNRVVVRHAKSTWLAPSLYVVTGAGLLLLVLAVAVGLWLSVPRGGTSTSATQYIEVGATRELDITDTTREAMMQNLVTAREDAVETTQLVLTKRVVLTLNETETVLPTTARDLFTRLEVRPASLLPSLQDEYMIGLYTNNNETSPFLVLTTNFEENARASMLAWEATMAQDLDPFFPNTVEMTPSVTTDPNASTTDSSSPAAATPRMGSFTDTIIGDYPARVLRSTNGVPILVWSMPKSYILITTNEEATRAMLDGLTQED